MGVHRFARALDDMQCKLIDKQGCKSITDEVTIRKFLNNIPDIIKKSITLHLTDNVTHNDIVTNSEQFEAANRGANPEHTKPGYYSKVLSSRYVTRTRSSYAAQQPRPGKGQRQHNRLAIPGARSTASAGTKDSDRENIMETLSETERMRRSREKLCL